MGRWLPWRYYCVLYCVLVTRLRELLTLQQAQGDNVHAKFVLIFFLIIINSFAIAAGKVVTGSLPAVVLFTIPGNLFNNRETSDVKRET